MTQQLRVCAALAKDTGSVPSTHKESNSGSRESSTLFRTHTVLGTHVVHIYVYIYIFRLNIHMHEKQKILTNKKPNRYLTIPIAVSHPPEMLHTNICL